MPVHARRQHLLASNRHDAWDQLAAISAPTFVLHGTDRMTPAVNADLLAGARHVYFHERQETATPAVPDFLDGS